MTDLLSAVLPLQKRGLENSLYDAKHWHDIELQNLGSVISKLEAEMGEIKVETEQQQRDRENLLTSKQQLEKDIAAYHCLLDGEQSRYLFLKRMENMLHGKGLWGCWKQEDWGPSHVSYGWLVDGKVWRSYQRGRTHQIPSNRDS